MTLEPIAIVGRGCVLPDAFDPDTFWANVMARRCSLGPDGGFVRDFDSHFGATGFAVDAGEIMRLDPLYRWVLHAARQALDEAGGRADSRAGTGLVLGNLSYPSVGLVRIAEHVWRDGRLPPDADPRDRFSSGLPAYFAARALGLGAGAYALDAACASALYAIKLACDRLRDGTADMMLAGAVSCPDRLLMRDAFAALGAVSPTGRCLPFHRAADGITPSEGATIVALMRLTDAVRADAAVLGVIRAVGLSNDGRTGGLLAPAEEGQRRAMRLAYQAAGISPGTVSLVECHATGTPVGDAVEARSMSEVFADNADISIGSVKSNVGHLLAAAGGAGLLKALGALRAGVRPASLGADEPIDEVRGSSLRVLAEHEDWPGTRRAAVSAFGFGGTNAHLIVDAWPPAGDGAAAVPTAPRRRDDVVITAIGARVAAGGSADDFREAVLLGEQHRGPRTAIAIRLAGLRVPPRDLEEAHAQHVLLLEAAREATDGRELPRERTMVVVGMGVDAEVARYPVLQRTGSAARSSLTSGAVLGTMPNLIANRINLQLDIGGPGYVVCAEEGSGLIALELAARALRSGEADAAVVGAVDLSCEPVHLAACRALGRDLPPGDAAVVLTLERLSDARAHGRQVIAVLDDGAAAAAVPHLVMRDASIEPDSSVGGAPSFDPAELFGTAHAAQGLVAVAAAATAVRHQAVPRLGKVALPAAGKLTVQVDVEPLEAPRLSVRLRSDHQPEPWVAGAPPRLRVYSGSGRAAVLDALAAGQESDVGPARLAVITTGAAPPGRRDAIRRWLTAGGPPPEGVAYRDGPVGGEVAFVFTNGSAAYPDMGAELALAFPRLADTVEAAHAPLRRSSPAGASSAQLAVIDQILGASLLGGFHVQLSRDLLGIRPDAAIGYSSGETAALAALGAWTDPAAAYRDFRASDLFASDLVGDFRAVRRVWDRLAVSGDTWATYLVSAPAQELRGLLACEPAVHLMAVTMPDSCVVGGEATACAAVLGRLGSGAVFPLDYGIAAHAPEVAEVAAEYRRLHLRPTKDVPGVRFYSSASGEAYRASAERAADALLAQMCGTVDFVRVIERAWADGVRVFIEHGPLAQCTGWIRRILADRDHVSVALDAPGGRALRQLTQTVADLAAAGVGMNTDALFGRLAEAAAPAVARGEVIELPAHPPAMQVPDQAPVPVAMPRAPALVPVAGSYEAEAGYPVSGEERAGSGPAAADGALPSWQGTAPVLPDQMRAAAGTAAPVASGDGAVSRRSRELPPAAAVQQGRQLTGPAGVVGRQLENVTALHRDFLARQAQAHAEFLRARQRGIAALVAAMQESRARAADATGSAPAAPVPGPVTSMAAVPVLGQPPRLRAAPSAPQLAPASPAAGQSVPRGPSFDRAQLEQLATGKVSEFFGPEFEPLDDRPLQTRLPAPPMLLVSRVTGIDAVPGSMGTGTIWTETDVTLDAWYLDQTGRIPAALMSEGGQADLLLISWLGIDLLERGDRVYRLLGCELTYYGSPAAAGETLRYEIHVDRHAEHDGTRLFFFRYDCYVGDELRITLRNGQAGFFSYDELAGTEGLSWDAAAVPPGEGSVARPAAAVAGRAFSRDQVRAFADGRPADCFGPPFAAAGAHVRTPRIDSGQLLLLDVVTDVDPEGGPWRRGYLRAETEVSADDWYFAGHFKNDPCMPGTLMFQGGLQAMAFYLAAQGFTLDRDGWRFEPVTEQPCVVRCRRQVSPASRRVVYEIFVSELSGGPCPTLYADILGTVDGVKAFHARRAALRLVPDWPLDYWRQLGPPVVQPTGELMPLPELGGLAGADEGSAPRPAAATTPDVRAQPVRVDGVRQDYAALLACSWGRPTQAFGPGYARFDSHRQIPHLPGPPYHFMSRIVGTEGPMGGMQPGTVVTADYDVPDRAWYFEQSGADTMPFAVIMEAALQTCGWLATYAGSVLSSPVDLRFRNLDGTGTVLSAVTPKTAVLRSRAVLRDISRLGDVIIESFTARTTGVTGAGDEELVFEIDTVFGFFPAEALAQQPGLAPSDAEQRRLSEPCDRLVDLRQLPAPYFGGSARLPGPMLLMFDRVTGYWPEAGEAHLGRVRAEKALHAGDWFFKAHFFQDPVQPGSLGIQALCNLLQWYLIERGLTAGLSEPRFEPVMTGQPVTWKYRGQVMPASRLLQVELELTAAGEDDRGRYATANGWLWVDGQRIYQVTGLGMRVVPGGS